jgi:predicted DNA-binding transcriptional regulator YafY
VRASRLLSILMLLQNRGRACADELARELGTSLRTTYRDLDALAAAGVPVYAERGPGGGYRLVEGYRTRLTGLDAGEAEAVFMIGMPEAAAALGLGDAAGQASRKLLAALPESLREGAGRMGTRFHLDAVDWYRDAEPVPHLPAVARAVLDQRRLGLRYESWTGVRDSEVEPLGLVLKAGSWYLVARGGERARIYKVGAIRGLEVLAQRFERPPRFDLPRFWSTELARFEARLRPSPAVVEASAEGARRLARLGAWAARAVADARASKDGALRIELPVESVEHAALMLLAVGPELTVVEPAALRARLGELATAIARRQAPPRRPKAGRTAAPRRPRRRPG